MRPWKRKLRAETRRLAVTRALARGPVGRRPSHLDGTGTSPSAFVVRDRAAGKAGDASRQ